MQPLTLVSLLAPCADPFYRELAAWLTSRGASAVRYQDADPFPRRARLLQAGDAQVGAVCGAHYVADADSGAPSLDVLAAGVRAAPRYAGRPVYFSDLIVRADSPLRAWPDLEGRVLACNEACSHSGYQVVRARLAAGGQAGDFFARALEAGSHRRAIELVDCGRADAAAIDSTVLEDEQRQRPELATRLRVIDSLGPSPAPPLVVSRRLPPEPRRALLEALLHMHEDDTGRALLHRAGVSHFVAREDADYQAIRTIRAEAERVALPLQPLPALDG